jgi:hypothetical protein
LKRVDGNGPTGAKRLPLPRRFAAALTDDAYAKLRALNRRYGLSNNYLLVVLLQNLDDYAHPKKLDAAFRAMIEQYGAPKPGAAMSKSR